MQTSLFLARFLGPILLVLGISYALNRKSYTVMGAEFIASRSLVYLAGALALAGGLAIVLNHNIWTADWRIIITLLGWTATLAGVSRLMFPDSVRRIGGKFTTEKPITVTGGVTIVLGAILCFAGYLR